jgi:hypothetical protein
VDKCLEKDEGGWLVGVISRFLLNDVAKPKKNLKSLKSKSSYTALLQRQPAQYFIDTQLNTVMSLKVSQRFKRHDAYSFNCI